MITLLNDIVKAQDYILLYTDKFHEQLFLNKAEKLPFFAARVKAGC